ncbi:MAG: mechanosensitive ion channel family protein [Gemmatimonadales bacterium]
MDSIARWLQATLGLSPLVQDRLATSLVVILILWALRAATLAIAFRSYEDIRTQYRWRKTTLYVAVLVGILIVGPVWFEGVQSLATILGLAGAGLAIALREPLVNLAGWAFILWRRPFQVGDRVQVGAHAGDVIDLRIFQFTLLEIGNWVHADQSTGRIIHVPNGKVFSETLANYTRGFEYIWNEVPVMVTFESDWQKAKRILTEIAHKHGATLSAAAAEQIRSVSRQFMIFYTTLTPIVYTTVADSGVLLTLRYMCDPRKRRTVEEAVWEDVLQAFAAHDDIDFAYPTRRFYDNRMEGKPGARAQIHPAVPRGRE